jgi:hypothetical protein
VDTALKVGAVEQSVVVSAQALTLETESGETCSQITTASMSETPLPILFRAKPWITRKPEEEIHLTTSDWSDDRGALLYFSVRSRCTSESLIRQSRLTLSPLPFKILTMAIMVFQFRVVAGTPNSLSIWPR